MILCKSQQSDDSDFFQESSKVFSIMLIDNNKNSAKNNNCNLKIQIDVCKYMFQLKYSNKKLKFAIITYGGESFIRRSFTNDMISLNNVLENITTDGFGKLFEGIKKSIKCFGKNTKNAQKRIHCFITQSNYIEKDDILTLKELLQQNDIILDLFYTHTRFTSGLVRGCTPPYPSFPHKGVLITI